MTNEIIGPHQGPTTDVEFLQLAPVGWAWEFLRCNPRYILEAQELSANQTIKRTGSHVAVLESSTDGATKWGLCAFERATCSYSQATIAWRPQLNPGVLPASAIREPKGRADCIDFCALNVAVLVIPELTGEQVLLCDGIRTIQLHVREGTVLSGPVKLIFHVEGLAAADQKVLTLNRFLAFLRKGQIAQATLPRQRQAHQWLMALKVYPLMQMGMSDREMAAALFPNHDVSRWMDSNDWMRTQMRRARALSQYFIAGGYLKILSLDNSDHIPGEPLPIVPPMRRRSKKRDQGDI